MSLIKEYLLRKHTIIHGYKIIMLKAGNATTTIEGDKEVMKYMDISGYFFKKEPLKRMVNH